MWRFLLFSVVASVVCFVGGTPLPKPKDQDPKYWNEVADKELQDAIKLKHHVGVAKNVILFLGDGMGLPSVTAGRILHGQMNGHSGEEAQLSFDKFPHVGLSRTYTVDHQTPDSAGTATAFLTGVKTNSYIIGQNAYTQKGVCSTAAGNELSSILNWSMAKSKSTGVVTTTRITHATPGAAYAHSAHRDWEGDSMMTNVTGPCVDIAKQLILENHDIKVLFGGGRMFFLPDNASDPEEGNNNKQKTKGRRDGRDLIQEWKDYQKSKGNNYKYVWNQDQFDKIDETTTDFVLGLFNQDHMSFELDRDLDPKGEPSLAEMTGKAIKLLQKNKNGFFMLVEGGRIDHGHHDGEAKYAIHDAVAFADAVAMAVKMTSEKDTLIVVTADHSHTFSFGGYPSRGNPIFDLLDNALDINGHTFTTLAYANGPGYKTYSKNINLTNSEVENKTYHQSAGVPLSYETHGGEDVAIYARGPMSHLFHGVHQQNFIAHVMAYASCVGEYADDKKCAKALHEPCTSSSTKMWLSPLLLILVTMSIFV